MRAAFADAELLFLWAERGILCQAGSALRAAAGLQLHRTAYGKKYRKKPLGVKECHPRFMFLCNKTLQPRPSSSWGRAETPRGEGGAASRSRRRARGFPAIARARTGARWAGPVPALIDRHESSADLASVRPAPKVLLRSAELGRVGLSRARSGPRAGLVQGAWSASSAGPGAAPGSDSRTEPRTGEPGAPGRDRQRGGVGATRATAAERAPFFYFRAR